VVNSWVKLVSASPVALQSHASQAADARNFLSGWFNSRRKVQDFWLLNQGDKESAPQINCFCAHHFSRRRPAGNVQPRG
jgi:hypothetical protein